MCLGFHKLCIYVLTKRSPVYASANCLLMYVTTKYLPMSPTTIYWCFICGTAKCLPIYAAAKYLSVYNANIVAYLYCNKIFANMLQQNIFSEVLVFCSRIFMRVCCTKYHSSMVLPNLCCRKICMLQGETSKQNRRSPPGKDTSTH